MNAKAIQLFNDGLSRYQKGDPLEVVIPIFQAVCTEEPEEQAAWVCLSWLYLLQQQPDLAVKAARKAVFLDRDSAQAQINLAIGLLESQQQGANYHLQQAQQALEKDPTQKAGIVENFQDALKRVPDWDTMLKIQLRLFPN